MPFFLKLWKVNSYYQMYLENSVLYVNFNRQYCKLEKGTKFPPSNQLNTLIQIKILWCKSILGQVDIVMYLWQNLPRLIGRNIYAKWLCCFLHISWHFLNRWTWIWQCFIMLFVSHVTAVKKWNVQHTTCTKPNQLC